MRKDHVAKVGPSQHLYRGVKTGLAWVENGRTGSYHSCHPNIDATGSLRGMVKLGYWKSHHKFIRSNGHIYNVSLRSVDDQWDRIAMGMCQCEVCQERRHPNHV